MNLSVEFHRLAAREVRNAFERYKARSITAPIRFRDAVNRAVDRACVQWGSLQRIGRIFRWVSVPKFPYIVILRQDGPAGLLVIAVAHTSQRPGYWKRRK